MSREWGLINIRMPKEHCERIKEFFKENPMLKKGDFLASAIEKAISQYSPLSNGVQDLLLIASDLPGMSLAIVQSHLIRFPKVTPEMYKRIIVKLNADYAEGTLKNPEAAAYGLCKQLQNGKKISLPDDEPAPQEETPEQPQKITVVPKSALMPFAR